MAGRIFSSDTLLEVQKSAWGGSQLRSKQGYGNSKALVFISHRRADAQTALAIAHLLTDAADVDVYLDSFNPNLSLNNDPDKVTAVIDFGLGACTHLIAVISNQTRGSWWVPYEIGVAKFRTVPRALVVLGEVVELPEYLRTTEMLKTTGEISAWSRKLPNQLVYKSHILREVPGVPTYRSTTPIFR